MTPRIWAQLVHLGENIGTRAGARDPLACDDAEWRLVTDRMAANRLNMVVIDLLEGVRYPSHPELGVRGAWSAEKLTKELARLRSLGLEPIPKLNFSACHDEWLGEWGRMLSTPDYYRVCADVIRDVVAAFGRPRLFHIGMDEERITHHKCCSYACARQGPLWWHDLDFIRCEVERNGSRAWMWIDHIAEKAAENQAYDHLPKEVMMSPWYYHLVFDPAKTWEVRVMHELDAHGYDLIPCGSICFFDNDSVERLSAYCEAHFDRTRLHGYLNAPWLEMNAFFKDRLILAGESVGRARKAVEG